MATPIENQGELIDVTGRPRLDWSRAVEVFKRYAQAVDAGKYQEAAKSRTELLKLGLAVSWQPGRARQ